MTESDLAFLNSKKIVYYFWDDMWNQTNETDEKTTTEDSLENQTDELKGQSS